MYRKSKWTKLYSLAGSGIRYMNHPKENSLIDLVGVTSIGHGWATPANVKMASHLLQLGIELVVFSLAGSPNKTNLCTNLTTCA